MKIQVKCSRAWLEGETRSAYMRSETSPEEPIPVAFLELRGISDFLIEGALYELTIVQVKGVP